MGWTKVPVEEQYCSKEGDVYMVIKKDKNEYQCSVSIEMAGNLVPILSTKKETLSEAQESCMKIAKALNKGGWV